MQNNERPDTTIYQVVVNHEEQYSIWPVDRELPLGWSSAGKVGTREECLAYIEEVWTDMRPLSLRRKMEEDQRKREAAGEAETEKTERSFSSQRAAVDWNQHDDTAIYQVIVVDHNGHEQYSIWPADRELPLGWRSVGKVGTREECMAYIEQVWHPR